MRLAVVTPCYNDAPFIGDCVASVQSAARLAGIDVEHVVVDDGSTDATEAVLKQLAGLWPILTHRLPQNRGCSAALNVACHLTAADWLLVLASDDMVTERAIVEWRAAVQQHPTANVIYSDLELFGTERGLYRTPPFRHSLLREKSIIPGASFLRRSLFAAVGGFDESLKSAQDWDLWVRADLVVGLRPVKLPVPLVRYRYHPAPRLHNESVRHIDQIRRHIATRDRTNAVLRAEVAA
jgi:glycosyltransferase involved in cell wall biosynthesis